tara:strand:+ start:453 stop:995 length:543 start_codon:yes stop_codon:yes gene_type:complete
MLEGNLTTSQLPTIPNSKLENSSVTINGSAVALGGSTTVGGGKIGQAVFASTSTEVSNSTTTYGDIGLSASITPSATSSKIHVTAVVSMMGDCGSETNVTVQHRIMRDSTPIVEFNTARINGVQSHIGGSPSLAFLDSPSTSGSAVTYKVQHRVEVANGRGVTSSWNSGASTITLMEVLV